MRIFWRILAALVLIAAVVGVGLYAYNLGIAQKVAATTTGSTPLPYAYPFVPFFGFGWGFLGCLVPLFLLCLILGSFRALFWHGPMGWRRHWHRHGPWEWRDENGEIKDVPPFFSEMHRKMHASPDWDKAPEDKGK